MMISITKQQRSTFKKARRASGDARALIEPKAQKHPGGPAGNERGSSFFGLFFAKLENTIIWSFSGAGRRHRRGHGAVGIELLGCLERRNFPNVGVEIVRICRSAADAPVPAVSRFPVRELTETD